MVTNTKYAELIRDPLKWKSLCWPKVRFYPEQVDVVESVVRDNKTFVPAGNKLGKDFIGGFIVPWFFVTRSPCRIVLTSAKDDHLDVILGETRKFFQDSRLPLLVEDGGFIVMKQREITKILPNGKPCPISYVKAMVSSPDRIAALQGHHAPRGFRRKWYLGGEFIWEGIEPTTLFLADEASSVPHPYYRMADTWAHRMLIIGNTWPCENFFKHAIDGNPITEDPGGDIPRANGEGYLRKVIRITVDDSPNVKLAKAQIAKNQEPTLEEIVPGVKGWEEYQENLLLWDDIQKEVSLYARFPKDGKVFLYPQTWLDRANEIADRLDTSGVGRYARAIAVDAAEGGDDTTFTATDELGIIEQEEYKTQDTNDVPGLTIAFGKKHRVAPENWIFDRGGGGKQHADRLRAMGLNVRLMMFGESATVPEVAAKLPRAMYRPAIRKIEEEGNRMMFKNRRAEMYYIFSQLLNPEINPKGFGIPRKCKHLYTQLKPIPRTYDDEGKFYLIPKGNRFDPKDTPQKQTLFKLLGRSPDHADGAVMATYCMLKKAKTIIAGSA